jgi:hypothetical protein
LLRRRRRRRKRRNIKASVRRTKGFGRFVSKSRRCCCRQASNGK